MTRNAMSFLQGAVNGVTIHIDHVTAQTTPTDTFLFVTSPHTTTLVYFYLFIVSL